LFDAVFHLHGVDVLQRTCGVCELVAPAASPALSAINHGRAERLSLSLTVRCMKSIERTRPPLALCSIAFENLPRTFPRVRNLQRSLLFFTQCIYERVCCAREADCRYTMKRTGCVRAMQFLFPAQWCIGDPAPRSRRRARAEQKLSREKEKWNA
jgi:hypothetical protein